MKRFRFLLAASVVAGASSVCVVSLKADDDDNQRVDRVSRMMNLDKDDDGKISKAEMPDRLSGMFAKADSDEDGFLTEAEIRKVMAGRDGQETDGQRGRGRGDRAEGGRPSGERDGERGPGRGGEGRGARDGQEGRGRGGERDADRSPDGPSESALMTAIDADRDGQLSEEEIKNAVAALKALDRNEDGMLDEVELRARRRGPEGRGGEGRGAGARGGEGRGPEGRGGEGRGPGARGGEGQGRENDRPNPEAFAAMMMERMDKNDDGKLTGDEIPERMAGRLADIDKNDDKAVDKSELTAMAEQMARGRGRGGDRDSAGRPGGDRPQRPDGARPGGGRGGDRGAAPGGQRPKRPASDDDIT